MNFFLPNNVEEASRVLEQCSEDSEVIAGSTWLMRAPIRDEKLPKMMARNIPNRWQNLTKTIQNLVSDAS